MRIRPVFVVFVVVCVQMAAPAPVVGADLPVADGVEVTQVGEFKVVGCPAAWDLPKEALSGMWTTQAMSNYRCEFHTDVAIRQIEVEAKNGRFDAEFLIEQEEGKDKEVDLELSVVDSAGKVLFRSREQIELDEGEMTHEHIKVRLPKEKVPRAAGLRVTIHGIGWG